jgi:TolB protein
MKTFLSSLYRRWRDFTWRGPSAGWLILIAGVLILGMSGLLVAGLLGLNQGLSDRYNETAALAEDHYGKGVDYLNAGQTALAAAEFEYVLQLDPGHLEAQRALRDVQATPVPTPQTSVQAPVLIAPTGSFPSPTSDPLAQLSQSLFQQAEEAVQAEDWAQASNLLEQLRALDSSYRPDDVLNLRFTAMQGQASALILQDRYEEALRALDQALVLRPDATDVQSQRELIALYVDAVGRWQVDWGSVVDALQIIYERRPDFLDVEERLAIAWKSWADEMAEAGQWCEAADRYAAALAIERDNDVQASRAQAVQFCTEGPPVSSETPQPGSTVGPTEAGQGLSLAAGQLAFATYSTEFDRWTVYRLPTRGRSSPLVITQDGSQPAFALTGDRLALRSERGDETGLITISTTGSDRVRITTFFEDAHASWSSDGRQVVFESNREGDRRWRIYRTGSRGGQEVVLGFGRWPAWSPQEDVIAYQGCDSRGNRCGLWLINTDGSNPQPITDVPGDAMPAWSPDGARLVFASAQRGGSWDIYVLEVATGNVATLASSPAVDAHPVWSPDGRQVAFLSNRDGLWAIHVVDVASSRTIQVNVLPGELPDWFDAQIAWGSS